MVGTGAERQVALAGTMLSVFILTFYLPEAGALFGNWRKRSRDIRRYICRLDKIPKYKFLHHSS